MVTRAWLIIAVAALIVAAVIGWRATTHQRPACRPTLFQSC